MGEILLVSTLADSLNPKLAFKDKSSPIYKRSAIAMSNLLETENSFLKEQKICKEEQNEQPTPKKSKKQLLEEYQVVLDLPLSMNIKEKQLLRKKILDNGGTISYIVTRNSNVVVAIGKEVNSLKQKMAKKYGVPVVMQSYIDECIWEQQLLDTKDFLLSSELKSSGFGKGKIIAECMTDSSLSVKLKSISLASLTPHPYEELHGYTLVKAVLLKSRNFNKAGINKRFHFYVLELHSASGEEDLGLNKQFCVYTDEGYLDKAQNGNIISSKKQCYYLETGDDALSVYSQLYFAKSGQPHCMIEAKEMLHPSLGTPEFQKLQLEWSATLTPVDKSILNLVDVAWMEAIGHLNQFLAVPPESIPLWKVDEAEGILLQISTISTRENWEELAERLSVEFYSILPHKQEYKKPIVTKKILSWKQDLCQVLRDMVSVSEASGWSVDGHLQAKYRALRCHIEELTPDSEKYEKIEQFLIESQLHATGIEIQEIYSTHRYLEAAEFSHNLPNKQMLFHATSPSNLVGILSQGLNLPKVVVQERGVERFDIGMLGGGIYFTNSLSTCIKYSRTSKERGTRFLLVSEVALGKVYETTKFDTSLTGPPDGFDSVHGVKGTESAPSDFVDDEFVIYTPCQQCMHYLVEFTLPHDQTKPYRAITEKSDSDSIDQNDYSLDLKDAEEKPKAKPKAGLQATNESETVDMPLKEVHIRAKLLDLVAQVVVFQAYKNLKSSPLECKYVFPLERGAAVCGFEAFINKKHIVGKIKRKEIAHKEYKEAVSKGHGAYLMDEESPDVFTVCVGNIPPLASVVIKITYILELPVNDEMITFSIPASVAPWIENQALHQVVQDVTDSVTVDRVSGCSIQVFVEMPFPINTISSLTHEIWLKRTETTAVITTCSGMDLSDGFTLLVSLREIHVPRMWTEIHKEKDSSQASMLVFYPEFEVEQNHCSEIIIALDASNSMKGVAFQSALQIALLCLMAIPDSCYFNIVAFGTVFQELFPTSHKCNPNNIKKAKAFLKNIMPSLGNTELFHLLRYYQLTAGNIMKNVIIISDGHINNEGTVLRNAKLHCSKVRIFTFGVSSTANKHMLCQLACWGSGAFEYMDTAEKSKWKSKVRTQIDRAMQAALANVRIEWQSFADDSDFLQAPQQIMSIFNGSRQVVYGFVPDCSMAKLIAVIDGKEYQTVVYNSSLNAPKDTMLHTLAARAIIRDWEDGLLAVDRVKHLAERKHKEEQIVELSKEYNLVTSITSFIAIEERDKDEEIADDSMILMELLDEADVDTLRYIEFELLAKGETRQYDTYIADHQQQCLEPFGDIEEMICGGFGGVEDSCDSDNDISFDECAEDESSDDRKSSSTSSSSTSGERENGQLTSEMCGVDYTKWNKLMNVSAEEPTRKRTKSAEPIILQSFRQLPSSPVDQPEESLEREKFMPQMIRAGSRAAAVPMSLHRHFADEPNETQILYRKSAPSGKFGDLIIKDNISVTPLPSSLSVSSSNAGHLFGASTQLQYSALSSVADPLPVDSASKGFSFQTLMQQQCQVPLNMAKPLPSSSTCFSFGTAKPISTNFSASKTPMPYGTADALPVSSTLSDLPGTLFGAQIHMYSSASVSQAEHSSALNATVPTKLSFGRRLCASRNSVSPKISVSTVRSSFNPLTLNFSDKENSECFGINHSLTIDSSTINVSGAPSQMPQSFDALESLPVSMATSSFSNTTIPQQQFVPFEQTELTLLNSEQSKISESEAKFHQMRRKGGTTDRIRKLFSDSFEMVDPLPVSSQSTNLISTPTLLPQSLVTSAPLKLNKKSLRKRGYSVSSNVNAIAAESFLSSLISDICPPQSHSGFATQNQPSFHTIPISQYKLCCPADTTLPDASEISDSCNTTDIEKISTYLKGLVKCKGGLPLCNAVDRYLRIFARKADNYDVIKLLDGTLKCYCSGLEESHDFGFWFSLDLDDEKLKDFKVVMEKIATDGYCEEDDCLNLDIITERFTRKLEDAGLNSLGTKAALDIKRMLATLAVLLFFTCTLLAAMPEKISGQHDFQKLENLSQLLAFSLVKRFPANTFLLVALKFIRKIEQDHSLVYRSLGCGINWEEFIIDYFKELPVILIDDVLWADIADSPDVSMCYKPIE